MNLEKVCCNGGTCGTCMDTSYQRTASNVNTNNYLPSLEGYQSVSGGYQ